MWTYQQSTGKITYADGTFLATGYAGNGSALNNPDMQDVQMHGPLPQGRYAIGKPYDNPHTGKFTMNLEPSPENKMFGRSLFRIHGDTAAMNHTASDGCIILGPAYRHAIADSKDDQLQVIA